MSLRPFGKLELSSTAFFQVSDMRTMTPHQHASRSILQTDSQKLMNKETFSIIDGMSQTKSTEVFFI